MATLSTPAELRALSLEDLRAEIAEKRGRVAKMRLGLEMRSEKDSAAFRRDRRQIARMLTVLREKEAAEKAGKTTLKAAPKAAKVPARTSSRRAASSAKSSR